MRTIFSTSTGSQIPVTSDLNVQPLMLMGKPVTNGRGEPLMNDRWIYIDWPGHGLQAMNVNRAKYCEKMYTSKITIQESIGVNKLMDDDLKAFVDQVSDKLVFEKYGKWYRIFLRKINRRKFGIAKVVPYKFVYNPNLNIHGQPAHQMSIDWRSKFYVRQ